jgi:hypothetical protein
MDSVTFLLDTGETVGDPREGPRRFWTAREQMILRNHYPQAGIRGCLDKLPGRSPGSIYQTALRLKLRSPRFAAPKAKPAETNDHIDGMIRRTYQNDPDPGAIKKLARTINRSRQWIRMRAIKLGIAIPRFKTPDWAAAEIEIIVEHGHLGPLALKRRLAKSGFLRTEAAIMSKLYDQGGSTEDPDHHSANGLARLFGIDIHVVTGWIAKGWLQAQRRGTARVDQQGGDQWWISRRAIRLFVKDSVQVIDFRKLDKVWLVELLTDTMPPERGESQGEKRHGRRQGEFMPVRLLKSRLDQEEAHEMAQEVSHWLHDLNEIDTARVHTEMRRHNRWAKYRAASQGGQGIPVGAAGFDDLMQAEVRRDFLEAIRTGSTPEDAADIAKERAESYVAKHNAQRPGDIHWQRSLEAYANIADVLVVSLRSVLSERPESIGDGTALAAARGVGKDRRAWSPPERSW